MTAASTDLVRRHFEQLWNRRDLSACDELMAADYVEHAHAPFGTTEPGRVHGPTAMRATVAWLTGQFPDIRMQVEAIIAEADLVAARVRSTGTHSGSVPGTPPATGRTFSAQQTHWFRVADGKLAEHWATRDDLTMAVQLGLVPSPGHGDSAPPAPA